MNRISNCCWQPLETAPKDGTYVILAGPTGLSTTPLRAEICRYDPTFWQLPCKWVNHQHDGFVKGGSEPTLWMPIPSP